jgi:multiple sugar transport system substrate-binding protein
VSNWSLSINRNSPPERQKAAWLLIQWATNKQNALAAMLAGVPAGRASAWNSSEYKAKDTQPDWTENSLKSFQMGQPQWNPPVINVPEIRDITGQVIVEAIQGKDVDAAAKKAAELMDKKMEI